MQNTPVALVTGANKGIGLAIAQGLAAHGFTVLIGSRNLQNGHVAAQSIGSQAHALQLDVTDQASITTAAGRIRTEFGRLDVLVNNAGVSHAGRPGLTFADILQTNSLTTTPLDDVRKVWETNVFGVIAVTQAMLPLLRQAPAARIVNIGSTGGSLAWNSAPDNAHRAMFGNYSASKSAAHAVTLAFAFALESTAIKVNIVCPGHTATALNNFSGARSVEQGAIRAVQMARLDVEVPTGTFSDEAGPVAW
jgi:NAD(P)-dependent dehydrogenase (short-subunit alcohol dehydrogenase family)